MSASDEGGPLSPAELEAFLAQPLLLKLGCVRPDGWPYVIPLWFAWSAQKLYVVGRERAVWIRYIEREPRVGVLIDEEDRRDRRVQMTATALVIEGRVPRAQGSARWHALDDDLLVPRYMSDAAGADLQGPHGLSAALPRRAHPGTDHVVAWRGLASALRRSGGPATPTHRTDDWLTGVAGWPR